MSQVRLPVGNRLERTINALISIGPAVLNGGLTTFLALALCSLSTGHVFLTFFKVFTLTVVFGLYHGLVVFPVVLATLGPAQQSQSPTSTPTMTLSAVKVSSKKTSTDTQNVLTKTNLAFEETEAERRDISDTKVNK